VRERRLPPLLRRAWYGLNRAFRRRIAHTGITPDQYTVLRTLYEQRSPELTQNELVVLMASDPNTMASLLMRMEKTGWLRRQPHERDGRARRVFLQPAGKRKFFQARRIAQKLQGDIMAIFPPAKQQQFLDDLAAVADACNRQDGFS
jgi:DNA-binding MarR family transcriptional regulator